MGPGWPGRAKCLPLSSPWNHRGRRSSDSGLLVGPIFRIEVEIAEKDAFVLADMDSGLRRLVRAGVALHVLGWLLGAAAFLTDPVPNPLYPWARLPVTLPVDQPHLGPYPASYTVGFWLTDLTLPAVVVAAWARFDRSRATDATLLVGAPGAVLAGCRLFCRHLWHKPRPPNLLEPDVALVCWRACTTYAVEWHVASMAIAALSVPAAVAHAADSRWGRPLLVAFGVLAFPLGLPALWLAWRGEGTETAATAAPA